MGDVLPSIPERVEKGIRWLEDEKGVADWADQLVEAMDAGRFSMASGCRCVVGTTLGEYAVVLDPSATLTGRELDEIGVPLGFNTFANPGAERRIELAELKDEWERRAREAIA